MWFWQRREVYMGKDGPQLYAVRTALEQAGIGFECIVRSGRNYTGADRRMTNAHSADAGIWYVYVRSADLEAAEVVTVRSVVALDVTVDYGLYERADLLIKAAGGKLAEPEFTDKVTLCWQMPEHTEGPLLTQLQELTRGTANVTVSEPFYAAF